MKNSINKITLSGNVGTQPTVKTIANNKKMAFLSLATHEFIKTSDGKIKRLTIWHKVVLNGRLAELSENTITKGAEIQIAGKLITRNKKSKEGITQTISEIRAKDLVIIGKA
jgi:single-strand DNA-binding protein